MMDYFLPMPIFSHLDSDKWGCAAVGKRDIYNGLEDTAMLQYSYWDGQIIKSPDGKFHMFASRWNQTAGHNGWSGSVAVHAVSNSITGPYVDKGLCWPSNQGGKGHNVTALRLADGTYACLVSDTRPGDFFTSSSPDGPWTFLGSIKINANGFASPATTNLSIIIRPDNGYYEIVPRSGQVMISSSGLLGPYVVQGNSVYSGINLPNLEDPVVWYSGGLYHIVVNSWSTRQAIHLTSPDGIKNWTNKGLAYDPMRDFVHYTDGTVNHWNKIERPAVVIENGHVTHFTFAVIDVPKEQDLGNDTHGSKILVVPFDGARFDGVTVVRSGEMSVNGKQKVLIIIDNAGKVIKTSLIIASGSIDGATHLDVGLYKANGALVTRISHAPVTTDGFALNGGSTGSRLSPGIYLITFRHGKQTATARLTIP